MFKLFLSLVILFKEELTKAGFKFSIVYVYSNDHLGMNFSLNDEIYCLEIVHALEIVNGHICISLKKAEDSANTIEEINLSFNANTSEDICINNIVTLFLALIPSSIYEKEEEKIEHIKHEVKEIFYFFKKQCAECDNIYYSNFITKEQYENICSNDNLISGLDNDGNYTAIIKSKCDKCVQ